METYENGELVHLTVPSYISKSSVLAAHSPSSSRWPFHLEIPGQQRQEGVSEVSVRLRRLLQAIDLPLYSPLPLRIMVAGSSIGKHTCASMEWEERALRAKKDFPDRMVMAV